MGSPGTARPRFVFAALYALAVVVIVDQAAELAQGLYPFRAGDPFWRFGAFGLVIGRASILFIADGLLLIAMLGRDDRRVFRLWAIAHLVIAASLLGGAAIFGLDAIEVKRTIRPEAAGAFLLAGTRAALVGLISLAYCGWAGVACWRAIHRVEKGPPEAGGLLLTGSGG